MSKLILARARGAGAAGLGAAVAAAASRLVPDNVSSVPLLFEAEGAALAVVVPSPVLRHSGASAYVGHLDGAGEAWWKPGAPVPDGAYALFRSDRGAIELLTDVCATRTIWYCRTDELFVASTSQRAIVALLGSYEPDSDARVWMLSSGTLGPTASWDRRIRRVPPDAKVRLDAQSWEVTCSTRPAVFAARPGSAAEHREAHEAALRETFDAFGADPRHWVLPLSGGYDSRGTLLFSLERGKRFRTVTWGTAAAMQDPLSDAAVARDLAGRLGLEHTYLATDATTDSVERILTRFVVCGEGRIDHLTAYADGFAIWRRLREEGYGGIIRSDEGFGWEVAVNPEQIRRSVGMTLFSDFDNLAGVQPFATERDFVGADQRVPADLERRAGETAETWRDRLYHTFRAPTVLAALTDLKAAYVEIANPLISRRLIDVVRATPDALRTQKRLWKEIVERRTPPVRFAEHHAIQALEGYLSNADVVRVLSAELFEQPVGIFSDTFLGTLQSGMRVRGPEAQRWMFKAALRRLLPLSWMRRLQRARSRVTFVRPTLDGNSLAFRAFLVSRMHRLLESDARSDPS